MNYLLVVQVFVRTPKGSALSGNQQSSFKNKHMITAPSVSFFGNRAIAETNAMITAENQSLGLGCIAHNRFYDRIERRDGVWKIAHRQSVYDMSSFCFPAGIVEIDKAVVQKYPPEYASLAYVLEKSGSPSLKFSPPKEAPWSTQ